MEKLLEIKNLNIEYINSQLGQKNIIKAVEDFSLAINRGEILAIAGESGCGKSSLSKAIIKLITPTSGNILYKDKSILNIKGEELKEFRQNVQMVFQNPYASLNPKIKIRDILSEPLKINTELSKSDIKNIVLKKINQVGLSEYHLDLFPHEFSGGQRQRIAIARALILNPEFIIADEPVSALDASIQAQIINLIKELKQKCDITMLFISHDLNVIKYIADRIGIMYLGKLVEIGTREEIFNTPQHPYTKLLLNSIPNINILPKNIDTTDYYETNFYECKFYNRCKQAKKSCKTTKLEYKKLTETHQVLCNL